MSSVTAIFFSLVLRCSLLKTRKMPYLLISTQVRLVSTIINVLHKVMKHDFQQERGPTIVGDKWSDPYLMKELDAKMETLLGNDL